MVNKKGFSIFFLIILILSICNCATTARTVNDNTIQDSVIVYVAGTYNDGTRTVACYWKNGVRFELTSTHSRTTGGITVSGNSIYVAGIYYHNKKNYACYWKDGEMIFLNIQGIDNSYASGIAVLGDSVYVSGHYSDGKNTFPCYWKDGLFYQLEIPNDSYYSIAGAITIYDNSVYIAGNCSNSRVSYGCYWKDGVRFDIIPNSGPSTVNSIAVSNDSVYVAGYYWNRNVTKYEACYWKDGILKTLDLTGIPDFSTGTNAKAIAVSDDSVYLAGHYFYKKIFDDNTGSYTSPDIAIYWKNGVRQPFDFPENDGSIQVEAITISHNSIYIAGSYYNGACYWKDGVQKMLDLTNALGFSMATAIIVK